MPQAGDVVTFAPGQTRRWQPVKAGNDGSFSRGAIHGYLASTINSDSDRVMILEASGHTMVYAGDEPRVGDPLRNGICQNPGAAPQGAKHVLVSGERSQGPTHGSSSIGILQHRRSDGCPTSSPMSRRTPLRPSWSLTRRESWRDDLAIVTATPDGPETRTTIPTLAPLSIRKVGFEIKGPAPRSNGTCAVQLKLADQVT